MLATLSKHHGLGNDFLVYDLAQGDPGLPWTEWAVRLCARTTGVGADGLLVMEIRDAENLSMRLFNADGTVAEMSGNGIRCLVQAAHRELRAGPGARYRIDTDGGPRYATVVADWNGPMISVSVDMGVISEVPEPSGWAALECDPIRPVSHVSLGNPHSVVGVEDVAFVDLERLGSLVPHVNLEIIEPGPGTNAVTMRVHERGVGITRACGTGACAAADAALMWGLVPRSADEVLVHMDGGVASVRIGSDRSALLTGPAVLIGDVTVQTWA